MKIKYLYIDKDGKIMLTKKELDEIMKECYDNGYEDAKAIYGSSISLASTDGLTSICGTSTTKTTIN